MPEDFQEKTEKASQKKLQDARKKGQVAKSKEFSGFVIFIVGILAILVFKNYLFHRMYTLFIGIVNHLGEPIDSIEYISYWVRHWIIFFLLTIIPILAVVFLGGVVANVYQVGFVISFESLIPKWDKINIFDVKNYKRFFNVQVIMRSFLGIAKLSCIFVMSYFLIYYSLQEMVGFLFADIEVICKVIVDDIFKLLISVGAFLILLSITDLVFQRWKFQEDMKMSKQEVREEQKHMEGDPKIKSRFRAMMQEMSKNRTKTNVPKSNVVVTNPTHYAVALMYDFESMSSPVCLAKGTQNMALFIKEIAKKNNVPIVENPPLAKSLYYAVSIGNFIPQDFYHAVAEVLAYVYRLNEELRK